MRYRRPYRPTYRSGVRYFRPGYGWVSPYFLAYPGYLGYDDSSTAPDPNSEGYLAAPQDQYQEPYPDQDQPEQLPPYPGIAAPAPVSADEEPVTLIFKDGRTPEQVHNYLLTRTTLFIADQPKRSIPIDQLDMDATERVNRDLGVDFQIPNSLR